MDKTIYCPSCGKAMTVADEHLSVPLACPHCQYVFTPNAPPPPAYPAPGTPPTSPMPYTTARPRRNKVVAGLLGIFLGSFGIHRFYLGFNGVGVIMLLITVLTCGIGSVVTSIWGLVEGILCLTGNMTDADGQILAD